VRALLVAALLLSAGAAQAIDVDTELLAGQEAYAQQRYPEAIARLEAVADSGVVNEDLYYDLGNAYFLASRTGDPRGRAGKLGRAILWYERALLVDPAFDDARFNLSVARETAAARLGKDTVLGQVKDPLWMRVVTWRPMATLTWTFLILDLVFFAVLIAVRFLPTGFTRTGLIVADVFVGLAGAVAALLLFGQIYYRENVRMSVVVSDEAVMREAPDPTRRELPRLHAGHRVVIVKEQGDWALVRLSNRVEGWVQRESVEEI
jgi:hypothetical protein